MLKVVEALFGVAAVDMWHFHGKGIAWSQAHCGW
jgi:hypothetical protein